jgi:hypothetical protein
MKGFEIASIAAGGIAAACWFLSARVRLTKIGFGQDELNHVAELSKDLQKMARWNFWAAALTGAASIFQVLAKVI